MSTIEEKKPKTYAIKVPVFTSEMINKGIDLFGGVTYEDMINFAKTRLDEFKNKDEKITKDTRNKTQTKEVDKVEYIEQNIGDRPTLLLKISAYNTNLFDGYVDLGERIQLKQNNKLGSDNHYALLYPSILGIDTASLKHQWLILVYEDPNKDSSDIISTVKLVLKRILKMPFANIKLPELLEELKQVKEFPELYLKLSSMSFDENDVGVQYKSYLTNSSSKRFRFDTFKNMPQAVTFDLISDNSYENEDEYQKKEIRIVNGRREYKITREARQDAQDKITETVESIFNVPIALTEEDLKDIYEPKYIISKLTEVLTKYLSNE